MSQLAYRYAGIDILVATHVLAANGISTHASCKVVGFVTFSAGDRVIIALPPFKGGADEAALMANNFTKLADWDPGSNFLAVEDHNIIGRPRVPFSISIARQVLSVDLMDLATDIGKKFDKGYTITAKAPNEKNIGRFPHTCSKCKGPAYIGFSTIECSRGCK